MQRPGRLLMMLPTVLAGAAAFVLLAGPSGARVRLQAAVAPVRLPVQDRIGRGPVDPRPRPAAARGSAGRLAAVAGLALVSALVLGAVRLLLAAAVAVGVRAAIRSRSRAGARAAERRRAVEACAALADELRAGRPPAQALASAAATATGPFSTGLAAAGAAVGLGGDAAEALLAQAALGTSAVPEVLRALAACWQVCGTAGSGLAAALDRLEEAMRAAEGQRRAVAAELAGPRATAMLLAVLPLGGVGLSAALGAHPLHTLLHTRLGLACLLAGTVLDLAGVLWTSRLVARASEGT